MDEWKSFGKAKNGTAVHFAKDEKARCNKSIELIMIEGDIEVTDITCAKCKQYKAYKDAVADTDKKEKPKEAEKKAGPYELLPTAAPPSQKKKVKAKAKKPAPKPDKEKVEKKEEPKPSYDISLDEPDADFAAKAVKNGYNIIHIPTDTAFFNGICKEVVEDAILNLNTIKERWPDKCSPIPKDFVTKCRKAVETAFKACKIETPKSLTQKVEEGKGRRKKPKKVAKKKFKKGDKKIIGKKKVVYDGKKWVPEVVRTIKRRKKGEPKRTIKRREKPKAKPKKRVIKRRSTLKEKLFGMDPNKPPGFIASKMSGNGIYYSNLISQLEEAFDLKETKAKSKTRNVIRKLTRKKGIEITIVMRKDPEKDLYKITK